MLTNKMIGETMSNYVPGHNAHIDTSNFMLRLETVSGGAEGEELNDMEFEEKAYSGAREFLSDNPNSVPEDTVICRFLTIEKYLWFLGSKSIFMGRVDGFDDPSDCSIPEDYAATVSTFYAKKNCPIHLWENYSDNMRYQWLISCWTEVESNVDDYLLWHRYAGGPTGVGITIPYGILRNVLLDGINEKNEEYPVYDSLISGYVDYGNSLKALPFNKRPMFKNEKEIRFVTQSDYHGTLQISIAEIFSEFGLRFSPDIPEHHKNILQDIWLKYGGKDDFVVAGI